MIKLKFETDQELTNEVSNVTWVTKSNVSSENSKSVIGLRFHKITPKIKDVISKNISEEDC